MKKDAQPRGSNWKGIDDRTVLRWEKIMARSGLTPGAVQRELSKNASLSRFEGKTKARIEKAQLTLDGIRAKSEDLRRKYSAAWDSLTRYQLLREAGVDSGVLQRWERLIVGNGLNPEKLEDELLQNRDLSATRKDLEKRLADLDAQLDARGGQLKTLEEELARLESQRSERLRAVDEVTLHFKNSVESVTEDATERLGGLETKAGDELKRVSAEAQSSIRAEMAAAAGMVDLFRAKIEETYESALQTGQAIGKNEALKPLVTFLDRREGKQGEVIPLMSLLTHSLAKWAEQSDPSLAWKARDLGEYLDGKLRGV